MSADLNRAVAIIEARAEAIEDGHHEGGPNQSTRDAVAASLRGAAAAIMRLEPLQIGDVRLALTRALNDAEKFVGYPTVMQWCIEWESDQEADDEPA